MWRFSGPARGDSAMQPTALPSRNRWVRRRPTNRLHGPSWTRCCTAADGRGRRSGPLDKGRLSGESARARATPLRPGAPGGLRPASKTSENRCPISTATPCRTGGKLKPDSTPSIRPGATAPANPVCRRQRKLAGVRRPHESALAQHHSGSCRSSAGARGRAVQSARRRRAVQLEAANSIEAAAWEVIASFAGQASARIAVATDLPPGAASARFYRVSP